MMQFHIRFRKVYAIMIGVVFFVAGTLKLLDPVGAGLVVEEYFKFLHIGFLMPVSKATGVALAFLEAITGAALITRSYKRIAAISASTLTVVFTILTLFLWIKNPPMDCGCFGEVIHLTHFQTFVKNIILLCLCAAAFLPFKEFRADKAHKLVSFWIMFATLVVMTAYSLRHIPIMDFTPYTPSSRLYEAAKEDMDGEDEYVPSFVYEKNGQTGVFTIDHLPDSTWTFVRSETIRREDNLKETRFPILSFTDADRVQCDSLAVRKDVLIVSVYRPEKMDVRKWEKVANLLEKASDAGFSQLLLAASTPEEFKLPEELGEDKKAIIAGSVYYADYKELISLNRANGGATWFHNGNLIEKWSANNHPGSRELEKIIRSNSTSTMLKASTKGRLAFQALFLYSFAVMILI